MFKINEKVVYPGHGVAIIETVVEKQVGGTTISFFKLQFIYKDMMILVPLHSLESSGVRGLCNEDTIERALNELIVMPDKKIENLDLTPSGWNKRNKEYQARIQNGKLQEIAKIYRDLMHISLHKELSFGEKHLLTMTEDLLAQEIVTVRNHERTRVLEELRNPFKQFMAPLQETADPASSFFR